MRVRREKLAKADYGRYISLVEERAKLAKLTMLETLTILFLFPSQKLTFDT